MVIPFRDLDKVCSALGLVKKHTKKGYMWKGFIDGAYVRIDVHKKADGRDVPSGTFRDYVRKLGFDNPEDFKKFLDSL